MCSTKEQIKQCQAIRFQAYCLDHPFLDPDAYPDHAEKDEFDYRSIHSMIHHKPSGQDVATVRLVLYDRMDPGQPFPIESFEILRRMKRDKKWRLSRDRIGEISRFAICKRFRRRIEDHENLHGISSQTFKPSTRGRRYTADITLGLFKAIVRASHEHKLTHWYAVMEPSLIRLLGRFGIYFCEVGPPVDYYGIRQPCISYIPNVLRGIHTQKRLIWDFITDSGTFYGDHYLSEKKGEPS